MATSAPKPRRSRPTGDVPVAIRRSAGAAPSAIAPLLRYLDGLADEGFYGRVQVSFQNGRVHDVKIEQTKKLHEL